MTPAQLRQHAANRFTSVNKQDWCDKAVLALRQAADVIERMSQAGATPGAASPVVEHVPADDTEGGAL